MPSPVIRVFYSPLPGTGEGRRGTSTKKDRVLPVSRHEEGKKLFLCLLFLSLPSAQHSPATNVAHFRVASFDPLCNLVQLPFTNETT